MGGGAPARGERSEAAQHDEGEAVSGDGRRSSNSPGQRCEHRPDLRPWRLGLVPRTVCAVKEKMLPARAGTGPRCGVFRTSGDDRRSTDSRCRGGCGLSWRLGTCCQPADGLYLWRDGSGSRWEWQGRRSCLRFWASVWSGRARWRLGSPMPLFAAASRDGGSGGPGWVGASDADIPGAKPESVGG